MVTRVSFVRLIARCFVVPYQQGVGKKKKKPKQNKGERREHVSNPNSHPPIDILEQVSYWAA